MKDVEVITHDDGTHQLVFISDECMICGAVGKCTCVGYEAETLIVCLDCNAALRPQRPQGHYITEGGRLVDAKVGSA